MTDLPKNPAPYSKTVLAELRKIIAGECDLRRDGEWDGPRDALRILDPMAGVGTIHQLADPLVEVHSIEIETEWAIQTPNPDNSLCGDFRMLAAAYPARYDVVVTSPDYGNRMADSHNAKDDSKRITYKHYLGRDLSPETVIAQWGNAYRVLHRQILWAMFDVCKPGGLVVINISNHFRDKKLVKVTEWYVRSMFDMGLVLEEIRKVKTPRMRFGENRERVAFESIIVCRKVA